MADVQELSRVTVHDAGLPPRTDDFAESFVGHVIYGLADLFSGYDGRKLAVTSRPLTTFSCLIGPLRSNQSFNVARPTRYKKRFLRTETYSSMTSD